MGESSGSFRIGTVMEGPGRRNLWGWPMKKESDPERQGNPSPPSSEALTDAIKRIPVGGGDHEVFLLFIFIMSPARTKRAYSFSGCKTCRRRHLKCDQSVPACNRCRAAGFACEGFAPSLRWVPYTGPPTCNEREARAEEKETEQFSRRHLFTGKPCS